MVSRPQSSQVMMLIEFEIAHVSFTHLGHQRASTFKPSILNAHMPGGVIAIGEANLVAVRRRPQSRQSR